MENKLFLNNISFHDSKVYAFGYDEKNNQFLLDVDYISSEWILGENGYYSFDVVPSTFVFENAWNIIIDISMDEPIIIDTIVRDNPKAKNVDCLPKNAIEYDWKIEFLQGEITLKAIGFSIYQRKEATLQKSLNLTIDDRNGISLKKEGILCQIY